MRSVFSQPVGRGFRGSGEQSSTQPPHFVPEGISSSLRDFIVLVFNIEVFSDEVFLKIKFLKKKKKKKNRVEYFFRGVHENKIQLSCLNLIAVINITNSIMLIT